MNNQKITITEQDSDRKFSSVAISEIGMMTPIYIACRNTYSARVCAVDELY